MYDVELDKILLNELLYLKYDNFISGISLFINNIVIFFDYKLC